MRRQPVLIHRKHQLWKSLQEPSRVSKKFNFKDDSHFRDRTDSTRDRYSFPTLPRSRSFETQAKRTFGGGSDTCYAGKCIRMNERNTIKMVLRNVYEVDERSHQRVADISDNAVKEARIQIFMDGRLLQILNLAVTCGKRNYIVDRRKSKKKGSEEEAGGAQQHRLTE
ncbi:unnamed protein product [Mytilus coruscus]|uniref:Uncharacterized protein n=1 Tax=Mytilus coruscus TaxID=42192 RepID=A0A6J8DU59_MYTCO|nr:unnamed protein product [Mytilus coruscus]